LKRPPKLVGAFGLIDLAGILREWKRKVFLLFTLFPKFAKSKVAPVKGLFSKHYKSENFK